MSRAQKFKEHQWQNLIVFVLCYNYICLCCEWIIHKHFFLLKSLGSHPPSLSLMTSLFKRENIKHWSFRQSWCFASWWCSLWPLCWFVWFVPVRKVIRQISRLVNLWIQRVVKATANLKENNSNWKQNPARRPFSLFSCCNVETIGRYSSMRCIFKLRCIHELLHKRLYRLFRKNPCIFRPNISCGLLMSWVAYDWCVIRKGRKRHPSERLHGGGGRT